MIERIVAGTDGSEQATSAVAWASQLAKELNAELLIVHAFDVDPAKLPGGYVVLPPEELANLREHSNQQLAGVWSEPARQAGVRWRSLLIDGNAPGSLIDLAEREHVDLIIVGNRGRGGFRELLFGSVGHHLVQHSRIPVVIVPTH